MHGTSPSRTELNAGTSEVRRGLEINLEHLEQWMQDNVANFTGPVHLEQFKGGQSNPTYKILTPNRTYVLRRKPPGNLLKSAHSVEREFRVLCALYPTHVPVPRPLALCEDETILGTVFYLMEFKSGRVFWDLILPQHTPAERSALWDTANDSLARLHSVDPASVGLADYGVPANYFQRQYTRWAEQYQYTREALVNPSMDRLVAWLPQRIPTDDTSRIVHGDYQFSNMIFAHHTPTLIGILDWELSTLGHPLSDLAYFCRVYHLQQEYGGLLGIDLRAAGIPSEDEYLARYLDRTGLRLSTQWGFYVIFSMFRLSGIRQGVARRVQDGTATSVHARSVAQGAVPIADAAWRLAQSLD
jgi:aminoglycoside phosphotransferase (APT) family kinase protein